MSVRQAAELDHALAREGWFPVDIKRLCKGEVLSQVLDVLYGRAKIVAVDHVVKFDSEPFVPEGFRLAPPENQLSVRMSGDFVWSDGHVLALIAQASTREGLWIPGRRALGAQLLDYMLEHPYLIPAELEGKRIFFWGTVYLDAEGCGCVRSLWWDGVEPNDGLLHIDNGLENYKEQ